MAKKLKPYKAYKFHLSVMPYMFWYVLYGKKTIIKVLTSKNLKQVQDDRLQEQSLQQDCLHEGLIPQKSGQALLPPPNDDAA